MEASITLKKVGKLVKGRTVLAGLTFGVEKGSMVAIVGDNDAGKSTLLRVLAGVENPEYGAVFIHGLDIVKRRSEVRSLVGYVPLENDLDPWLSIEQNIRFIGTLYGITPLQLTARIQKYSAALGIGELLDLPANSVSPGGVKKAMIVRALVHEPEVLILDEPTAFMDAQSQRLTWKLLKSLSGEKTILYASQSLNEVEQAHDRILILHEGRIVLDGSLDKLLASTLEFLQFQIEFEDLSDDLFQRLKALPTVVSPARIHNTFHFYGRSRKVFFQVVERAADNVMKDLDIKKLGLRDLMDSAFARKGLE
jgi:ABC-type multidrug transport system ATPase subunit